jgi:hypothetical protein
MPVKIFQAAGKEATKKLEAEIDAWLASLGTRRVKQMNTAASAVRDAGSDETAQYVIVTFLFD